MKDLNDSAGGETPLPPMHQSVAEDAALFDRVWRQRCMIRPCSISEVDDFIQAHYLRKRPAIVVLTLLMLADGVPVGCVMYSMPPREADKRYGGKVWELARLYLLDEIPKNAETWLIARSVRYIADHHGAIDYLLSYADPSAGHRGTIYKAGNWVKDGRTDDERKTPRNDYVDGRTGKKYGRKGNMPPDAVVIRKPRVSKWRFVYPMRRKHGKPLFWGSEPLESLK